MKNPYFILCFVSSMYLASCTFDEEIKYSCDEITNMWVKENLTKIRALSRSEWINLDASKQIASYRAFTPEQRILFWKTKVKEVKKLDWNEAEIQHIEDAEKFIDTHHHLFVKNKLTDEESDELELFFYKWQKDGIEKLGWTERIGKSIFVSGDPVIDTKGNVIYKKPYPKENCHCQKENDFCNQSFGPCIKVNWCVYQSNGCGWLFLSECNGRCNGV